MRQTCATPARHVAADGSMMDASVTTLATSMQVSQLANYLKSVGVGRGSDVTIYMPMIPELPAAMVPPFPSIPSSALDMPIDSL